MICHQRFGNTGFSDNNTASFILISTFNVCFSFVWVLNLFTILRVARVARYIKPIETQTQQSATMESSTQTGSTEIVLDLPDLKSLVLLFWKSSRTRAMLWQGQVNSQSCIWTT